MGCDSRADQGVVVTVCTAGSGRAGSANCYQRIVSRGIGGMGRFPSVSVTGGTVTAGSEVLTDRCADPGTGRGIVTANTIGM